MFYFNCTKIIVTNMDNHQGVNWQFGDEAFFSGQVKEENSYFRESAAHTLENLTDPSNRRLGGS